MPIQTWLNISLAIILAFSIIIAFFSFGLLHSLGAFSLVLLIIFIAAGTIYTITKLNS